MNLKNKLLIYLKVNYILCVIRLMTAFNTNTGVSQSVSFLTQLTLFEAATVREREFFLAQFCSILASEQTCIFFLKQKLFLVTLNLLLRKVYFFFQILNYYGSFKFKLDGKWLDFKFELLIFQECEGIKLYLWKNEKWIFGGFLVG
jgi:hypothetical protein